VIENVSKRFSHQGAKAPRREWRGPEDFGDDVSGFGWDAGGDFSVPLRESTMSRIAATERWRSV
jgi:hypothetical protein